MTATQTPLGVQLLLALLCGLVIGALTLVLQGILPGAFNQFANSGAVWVVVAYIVGWHSATGRRAVAIATLAVIGEVLGYYIFAYFQGLMDIMLSTMAVVGMWLVVAVVAGPFFGGAGYLAHRGTGIRQKLAMGLLGAVFIGEGLYLMTIHPTIETGLIWLVVAVVLILSMTWNYRERVQVWVLTVGAGLLFFGAQRLLAAIDSWRAGTF